MSENNNLVEGTFSALQAHQQGTTIKRKIKIALSQNAVEFLAGFLAFHFNQPIDDYVLEQTVAIELYARYWERFMVRKPGTITITAAEAIAVKRLLFYTPIDDPVTDVLRNDIFRLLHEQIDYM